jgi:hypothetical protein
VKTTFLDASLYVFMFRKEAKSLVEIVAYFRGY